MKAQPKVERKAEQKAAFARCRKICLAMPGVTERTSWGFPNWLVGGKMFAASGIGHGGAHLVFKVADRSVEADPRFKPVSSVGTWKGYEDWVLYFFDWDREDDWTQLETLLEVSWELLFAKLEKRKQDSILAGSAPVKRAARKPAKKKASRVAKKKKR